MAVPSLTGSAIVLWNDLRLGADEADIFGERIDARGLGLWQVDGAPVSSQPFRESNVAIASDGGRGVLAVWEDMRDLKSNIYAQRLGPGGVPLWNENGVPISTKCWPSGLCGNPKRSAHLVADGSGGAFFAWLELRDGFHWSIWAQHVDSSGAILWEKDGISVAEGEYNAQFPRLTSDGEGGAIIVWQDARDVLDRLFAQRYDADGTPLWAAGGSLVVSYPVGGAFENVSLLPDGTGGVFLAWSGGPPGLDYTDLYAQRIDGDGIARWTEDGVPFCTLPGYQNTPVLVSDGASGIIAAWEDQSGLRRIAAQRLSPLGEPLWADQGISVSTQGESLPDLVSDGASGAIVVWDGFRIRNQTNEGPSLFAQRLGPNGQLLWGTEGFEIDHQPAGSYLHGSRAVTDGEGGVVVYYALPKSAEDSRTDIYAQRISDRVSPPGGPHTLRVTKGGTGGGTITSTPPGIDCGADCVHEYDGTIVDLLALPEGESEFSGWTGNTDCLDGRVNVSAAKRCTAVFDVQRFWLSIEFEGGGSGRVRSQPAGIDCRGDCWELYPYGTSVSLDVQPDDQSRFVGFRGDPACGSGNLIMTSPRTCIAVFAEKSRDRHLEPGFPVQTYKLVGRIYQGGPPLHTLVGNIDDDPGLEIVVTELNWGPLHAWNADGSHVPGWPLPESQSAAYPAMGELRKDLPGFEIVAGHWDGEAGLVGYSGSGSILSGWPRDTLSVKSPPALADIDGDGIDEIFAGQDDGKLHGYYANGTELPGWPVLQGKGQTRNTPAIGDLNGDGDLEIVTANAPLSPDGVSLFAYHHDGTPVSGFPISFEGWWNTMPVLGDVDGDGSIEIMIIAWNGTGPGVLVLSHEGVVERMIPLVGPYVRQSVPALADFDSDCIPEIVAQTEGALHVVRGDGSSLPSWPASLAGSEGGSSPVVGDVDGDRKPEIVITTTGELRVYKSNGRLHSSFPKRIAIGPGIVPAIADIDLDGRNEILVTGDFGFQSAYYPKVWAYDLGGPRHGEIDWGQLMGGPQHQGFYRCIAGPRVSVELGVAEASEGSSAPASIILERAGLTSSPLTVFYTTEGNATPSSDYVALSGTAVINEGSSSVTVPIAPLDDSLNERCETVTVKLTPGAGYQIDSGETATAVIWSDDGKTRPCWFGRAAGRRAPWLRFPRR